MADRGSNSGATASRDHLSACAHVLRRTTFGPFPGQTERLADSVSDASELVEHQLAAAPLPFVPFIAGKGLPDGGRIDIDGHAKELDLRLLYGYNPWWVDRMRSDEAGLHERMTWFWHTHFTTSNFKVPDNDLCWRQLRTLHRGAMGNFGDLAKALAVDGAMLVYLDGDGSLGSGPNENFARELMELFTLGIGNYSQADVRAAALAFSGWSVHYEQTVLPTSEAVRYEPASGYHRPVTFLGKTAKMRPDDVIDQILRHDACAPFVVGRLWDYLVGGPRDDRAISRWAASFRRSGYEIAPLVASMVRSDEFHHARRSRPRTALEWHCAVVQAAGVPHPGVAGLSALGQLPYFPPSVAGWPNDTWLSPTQFHARMLFLSHTTFGALPDLASLTDPSSLAETTAARCGLFDLGTASHGTLGHLASRLLADRTIDGHQRAVAMVAATVMTPEFALA